MTSRCLSLPSDRFTFSVDYGKATYQVLRMLSELRGHISNNVFLAMSQFNTLFTDLGSIYLWVQCSKVIGNLLQKERTTHSSHLARFTRLFGTAKYTYPSHFRIFRSQPNSKGCDMPPQGGRVLPTWGNITAHEEVFYDSISFTKQIQDWFSRVLENPC